MTTDLPDRPQVLLFTHANYTPEIADQVKTHLDKWAPHIDWCLVPGNGALVVPSVASTLPTMTFGGPS